MDQGTEYLTPTRTEWTRYRFFLAVIMVFTGSINTLSTKWADQTESVGSDNTKRAFDHPYLQATAMFLGEMLCLVFYKILNWRGHHSTLTTGNQNFNPFILLPAALLDMIGTSIMYIGLTLTYASSFQMLRGSVIVFVAVLSVTFLKRKITQTKWIGIGLVIFGLVIVGVCDVYFINSGTGKGRNSIITGDFLIVIACIVTSVQMIYEEKYVAGLDIPALQAVGWEGMFGFSILSALLIVFYWIPAPPYFGNNPRHTMEDAIDGFIMIARNPWLAVAIVLMITSIAFFNFAGISVTKEMSATTRMVLDSIRTFFIWMASLSLKWQDFHGLQLLGFALLLIGMFMYNDIMSLLRRQPLILSMDNDDECEEPIVEEAARVA